MTGNTGVLTSLAFNADGKRLAAGSRNGTVKIYTLRKDRSIEAYTSMISRHVISKPGSDGI